MEMYKFFKSIIDKDTAPVVICDIDNIIIYMNPTAVKNYDKYGGAKLIGKCIFDCHNNSSVEHIKKTIEWFKESPNHNRVFEAHGKTSNKDLYIIALRDEDERLIGYYEKQEFRNAETMAPYEYIDD